MTMTMMMLSNEGFDSLMISLKGGIIPNEFECYTGYKDCQRQAEDSTSFAFFSVFTKSTIQS